MSHMLGEVPLSGEEQQRAVGEGSQDKPRKGPVGLDFTARHELREAFD